MAPTDPFHTGFVVPDIASATEELTAAWGLSWTTVQDQELPVVTPDGPITVRVRFAFSREDGHRIELIEPVERTVWTITDGAGAHHLGAWSDDLAADSVALEAAGSPRVLTFDDGSGEAARFAYHRLPSGPLIELVDAGRRSELETFYRGGTYVAAT